MTYKQIKWLILTIPTISVGLWEYIRHEYLLPFISMELGNWLTPVIVLAITLTLLVHLFLIYEKMQEDLKKERAENAVLQERERIARELHDGMAQTLFLCSVELDALQTKYDDPSLNRINQHLRQLHDDVRQAITNLKTSDGNSLFLTKDKILHLIGEFEIDTGIDVTAHLQLEELNLKEKVELFACLQEAFTNIRKHAKAGKVSISLIPTDTGWKCTVEDDGIGFDGNIFSHPDRYGLRIMQERAKSIGARLQLRRQSGKTIVSIEKGGDHRE
ncbi:sensor histidine kinase [Thermoactinomyces mirandus]|uniref:histidine kinase n=1 Tax=Thermoactinomyces mirandus TaxID=2756294 RepID=A0A7W2ASZ6_9BACL|nr:histidine kinase [Thermoactinomyces mirandus]MBA4603006.1 sensor histidine kinase [Thermoactinomyces mirandus]